MKDPDDYNDIPDWSHFQFHDNEENEGEEWKNRPKRKVAEKLYRQGGLIYKYSKFFCESLKGEMALASKDLIMQNAMMICPKIVGAEAGDLYILKMENASIIRSNCKELLVQVHSCALFEEAIEEYAKCWSLKSKFSNNILQSG